MQTIEPHTSQDIRRALQDARDSYQRYGRLIDRQIQAVGKGDLDQCRELAKEREEESRKIEGLALPLDGGYLPQPDPQIQKLIAEVRLTIDQVAEADRKLRSCLLNLRNKAVAAIVELDSRGGNLRTYLAESRGKGRVDIRL